MFLPVKYYHYCSFHTMVQTSPSLLHPDPGQLLYTTCKINKKSYINKNFQTFTPRNFPLVEIAEAYSSILRMLHGQAEIQNFSSSVEKHFTSEHSEQLKYFSTWDFVSSSHHVMFFKLLLQTHSFQMGR